MSILQKLKQFNEKFANSKDANDFDEMSYFQDYIKNHKSAKSNNSSIPPFYQKIPREEDSLQQKVREEARAVFLQRRSAELLNNDELQGLWYLLDKHRTPTLDGLAESGSLSYEDYCRTKEASSSKCQRFFSAEIFARLTRTNPSRIAINDFFSYVMKTIWLHQTRIGLSLYDVSGQGYLKEPDLENYIMELIPTLPQLDSIEKSFHPFYVCTAVRKFFFFLDPMRTNRVKIVDILASSFLDDLLELRDGNLLSDDEEEEEEEDDNGIGGSGGGGLDDDKSDSLASLDLAGSGGGGGLRTLSNGKQKKKTPKNKNNGRLRTAQLENNWFSAHNAYRVYGNYLRLDKDQNGMLSRQELSKFMNGTLTDVFLDRVFQECLTFEGEMDYKGYLDFVLALENKREPQALQYLFRILDVESQGYLTPWTLNYFYRSIHQSLVDQNLPAPSLRDIQDEIFDLVKPKDPFRITLEDLIRCGQGDTVIVMLTDLHGFWNFETSEGVKTTASGPIEEAEI